MSGVKPPLLHFVTLYSLNEANNKPLGTLEPRLFRCFPEPSSLNSPSSSPSKASLFLSAPPAQTGLFCFPDIDRISARFIQLLKEKEVPGTKRDIRPDQLQQRVQDISFTLLLTDDAGKRYYGFAQRLALPGLTGSSDNAHLCLPACVCLVTSYPWFQFWRLVLGWFTSRLLAYGSVVLPSLSSPSFCSRNAEQALDAVWRDVEELASALLAKKNVKPNELMSVSTAYGTRRHLSELVKRPDDTLMPVGEDVSSLMKAIGVEGLLAVFAGLLLERRILLVSNNMRTLSRCVFATHSMIWPFVWQHVCIPIIPSAILEYLEAPMPFLIGVQQHHYLKMQSLICDAIIVNLDSGEVEITGESGSDVPLLPAAYAFHLKQSLTDAFKTIASPTGLAQDSVYGACRVFLAKTVGHYEKFVIRHPGSSESVFDKDSFLASKQKPEKKFWAHFYESQMFQQFISEKLDMFNSPSGVVFVSQFEIDINNNSQDDTVRYLGDTAKAQMKKIEMKWKGSHAKQALKQNIMTVATGAQQSLAKYHIASGPTNSSPSLKPASPAGTSTRLLRQFPKDAGRRVFPVDDPFTTVFEEIHNMFTPPRKRGASASPAPNRQRSASSEALLFDLDVSTSPSLPESKSHNSNTSASDLLFGSSPASASLLDMDLSMPSSSSVDTLQPTTLHRPVPPVPQNKSLNVPTLTVDDYFGSSFTQQNSANAKNADAFFTDSTFLANSSSPVSPTHQSQRPRQTPTVGTPLKSDNPVPPSSALAELQKESLFVNDPFPPVKPSVPPSRPSKPQGEPPSRPAKPAPPARPSKSPAQQQPPSKVGPYPTTPAQATKTTPTPPPRPEKPKANPLPPIPQQRPQHVTKDPFPEVLDPFSSGPEKKDPFPTAPQKPANPPPTLQAKNRADPFPTAPKAADPFPTAPQAKKPSDPFPTAPQQTKKAADPFPAAPQQTNKAEDPFPAAPQQRPLDNPFAQPQVPFPEAPRKGTVSIDDFFTPQTANNPFMTSASTAPSASSNTQKQQTKNVFDFF